MNIKKFLFVAMSLSVGPLLAESMVPDVTNVNLKQTSSRRVVVTYDLDVESAVVTFDIQTNGVSIGKHLLRNASGDVFKLVASGKGKQIVWNPREFAEGVKFEDAKAIVTAWKKGAPPDYYVLDLTDGTKAFYEGEDLLPLGIDSDVYRTTKMVFRRIHAKAADFIMGSPTAEWNKLASKAQSIGLEAQHNVAFTEDFYMGVFEVTQAQWSRVYGSLPAQGYTGDDAALCPVANVSTWNEIRCNEGDCGSWPVDGRYPQNTHFLGKLRKLAGGTEVDYPNHSGKRAVTGCGYDIPLEAQWEFACRAGTSTAFNNGQDITDTTTDPALEKIAWYKSTSLGHVHPVGRLKANAWGLYDMHGNVTEWVRDTVRRWGNGDDWYKLDRTDPEGDTTYQNYRCKRGGHYDDTAFYSRSALRGAGSYGGATDEKTGFRVSCPVDCW